MLSAPSIAARNGLAKGSMVICPVTAQRKGREARALFDQKNLPRKEQVIRNRLRNAGYWMR
ncbi:hypothetical protein HKCCD6035_11650 [Rhodobacterales bacterium HKCCD6035]|nr:hypothetical protein [Rhodobacterales bacterium HKCCD6035]